MARCQLTRAEPVNQRGNENRERRVENRAPNRISRARGERERGRRGIARSSCARQSARRVERCASEGGGERVLCDRAAGAHRWTAGHKEGSRVGGFGRGGFHRSKGFSRRSVSVHAWCRWLPRPTREQGGRREVLRYIARLQKSGNPAAKSCQR